MDLESPTQPQLAVFVKLEDSHLTNQPIAIPLLA